MAGRLLRLPRRLPPFVVLECSEAAAGIDGVSEELFKDAPVSRVGEDLADLDLR